MWLNGAKKKTGKAIIFGHTEFNNPRDNRPQIEEDVKSMKKAFESCGIDVPDPCMNLKVEQVKEKIKEFSLQDFRNDEMAVVMISTHGDANNVLQTHDGNYNLDKDVIVPLIAKLKNNFIWLIINACRGDQKDYVVEVPTTENTASNQSNANENVPEVNLRGMISEVQEHKNLLISYCCMQGRFGFSTPYHDSSSGRENPEPGSWFITKLCVELENWGKEFDLLSVLARVTSSVVQDKWSQDSDGEMFGESPSYLSFLPYQVYINRERKGTLVPEEYREMQFQGRAVVSGQKCHKQMAVEMIKVLQFLNFNSKFVNYSKQNIENTLKTEIVNRIQFDHTMFVLVVFIQGEENHQKLGPVLRELLVATEENKLAGKPRIIILVKIKKDEVDTLITTTPFKEITPSNQYIEYTTERADVIIFYCQGSDAYKILLTELGKCKDNPEGLVSMFTRVNDIGMKEAAKAGDTTLRVSIIESTLTKRLIIRSTPEMCPDHVETANINPPLQM